jgi:hypothetical protein
VTDAEVEKQIRALLSTGGHEADRREHDRALAFLLAHADEAHPRLLALLDPSGYVRRSMHCRCLRAPRACPCSKDSCAKALS